MKKLSILIVALLPALSLFAQAPVNDDCAGLIDLGFAPVCPPDTFTNLNATASDIGFDNNPSCFNGNIASRDVWFAFTCPDTLFDFRITVTGVGANNMVNPEFAVYRGDCTFDGLAELLCASATVGETEVFLDVQGLTPGLQYFIRVSDYSTTGSPNWGDFTLCVANIPPASNIDDGGSTLCSGTLYDTGGPDGDYGPNENHTFVICPTQPSECITFTLTYFNIEEINFPGDALTFYDGPNTSAPQIVSLQGGGFGDPAPAAGGGVCFQVQASSGCLTVAFASDASVQFEGFEGHWECSTAPCPPTETMSLNTNITADSIVNAIATPFTTVTVTDINCPSGAYGTFGFPTVDNELGPQKGLILTSGSANIAIGPNNLTGAGFVNGAPGDDDLDFLSIQQGNGTLSNDACIVELDVFVATDQLTFEYVFGSEEYPEYVNSNFNDIFAFLVSGPGIAGDPGLGGATNIALVPGSNDPVQINSVNNLLNWEYYRNTQTSQVLQYDGLTSDYLGIKKSLTARANVIPCNTYHLKLAIADRGDSSFDSGVFISEIKGGTPDVVVQFASGIDYFVEDCSGNQDQLVISLPEPADSTTSFEISISGSATLGVDYTLNIPPVIVFNPGQQSLSFPIFPIADNMPEGTETIIISLSNDFGCGSVIYKTITVEIKDNVEVVVNAGADTLYVCAGSTLQLEGEGAVDYFWAPPGAVSNPFIANPTITPTQDVLLIVTGTLGTCVDMDSVFVTIIDPVIDVTALADTNICQGVTVPLQAINNVANSGLVWTPAAGLDDPNSPTPLATPSVTTTYVATVTIAGCSVSDTVTINVDTLFLPTLFFEDTTVCQNYPVQLANVLNTSTEYLWTPSLGLDDPTSSGPVALPDQSVSYTLSATSDNGYCSETLTAVVNIIAADVDIEGADSYEICLGESVDLNALAQPAGAEVSWTPAFYVSNPTGPATTATPDESVTIFSTYTINGCLVRDSVYIRVDSLPLSDIRREMDKAIYCPGDTIYFISPTYEPANFPDIQHQWLPFGTQLTPDSNWNMVIIVTETHTYERITVNRACVDTSTVDVPVAVPPTITITATPEVVCPGQPVQLLATVDPPQPLEWMMDPTLSCTDCPNPIATPFFTTSYSVSAPEADCPAGASIAVAVLPPPDLQLAADQIVCLGDTVLLNAANQPGVTYTWTSEPAGFTSNEATPSVQPTQTTTYKVFAQGPSCSSEGEVTLTVASASVDAGTDREICLGESITLSAAVTGTPGAVVWQPGNLAMPTINVTPVVTTVYTATLFYGEDCEDTDTVVVAVLPAPVPDVAADTSFCIGGSVQLNFNSEPGVTYTWTSEPAGFTSSESMPVVSPQQTTTYNLVASNGICDRTFSIDVEVAAAALNLGPDQILCFGDRITLSANPSGTPGALVWQPGGENTPTINVTPAATTQYVATLVFGPGCVVADSVLVTVVPSVLLSDITAVPDTATLCEGTPLTLSVSVIPANANLVWTVDGDVLAGQTDTTVTVTPEAPPGGSVVISVTATDANGCSATAPEKTFVVERCYFIPNAFTPDGDSYNDNFGLGLKGGEIEVVDFRIFNRWGNLVFEAEPGKERWDGTVDGKLAPMDVYIYVMKLRFPDGREETFKGDVTLIR